LFRLRTIYPDASSGLIGIQGMMGPIKGACPSEAPKSRRGGRRGAYQEQDSTMTKIDCLIEVAKKLKEARNLGERSSDRALLYFIDMTLAHVCDQLDARSEAKGAENNQATAVKAAA
jgi:hypothetical protein